MVDPVRSRAARNVFAADYTAEPCDWIWNEICMQPGTAEDPPPPCPYQ